MATYFRLLDPMRQFLDENGVPYNGGKLYTYTAGTTANKAAYEDNAGVAQHSNPIVLDSAGRIPAEVWGTTGAYKLVLHTSGDVLVDTSDNIDGINDTAVTTGSEWTASGLEPTYVSASSFTFEGDQTSDFHIGRRLRLTDSSTLYGFVQASAYSDPNTTVTVVLDSGSLSASLSAVAYGLNSFANTSLPILAQQSSFYAERTADTSALSADTWTAVSFTEVNDAGNEYGGTNFVPKVAGMYLLTWCVPGHGSLADQDYFQTRLYDTTGTTALAASTLVRVGASGIPRSSGSVIVPMTASQPVQVQVQSSATIAIDGNETNGVPCFFSGVRIN